MLLRLSASCSAVSPCVGFILSLVGCLPPGAPGSSKSVIQMKEAEQWLVQLRSHAHHWINHYDQKKLVLLLVHLMISGNPRDQSKEHDWSPTPRGGPPKEGRKLSVEGGCCGDPKIPLRCQLQNPASIV